MVLDLQQYPVLVVDDERDNLDAFRFNFRKSFRVLTAGSGAEALELLDANDVAVVVADQRMPRMTGLELLREVNQRSPDTVGIILTAFTDTEVLIEAISLGHVYRYITKPWDAKELRAVLTQAIERFDLVRTNRRLTAQLQSYSGYLRQQIHGAFDFGNIVGGGAALKQVLAAVERVAPTTSTVLLRGETGTGKELVAHAIHINSPREDRPFVRVNCAALAPGVLESELFGHEKGAFTGAANQRQGRFELADGGTLFLDEVGDLPLDVQVKLLRVLQEQEFERVGGTETVRVDVRVVSATNRDLERAIEDGEFREDLYYRLNVFPILLPPLRERLDDLPPLVDHFVGKYAERMNKAVLGFADDALEALRSYAWPGNVRELENVVERALIVAAGPRVQAADLDFGRRGASSPGAAAPRRAASDADPARPLGERLADEERREIVAAVERNDGNIAATARDLSINRSTLYYRMRKHGLEHLLPTRPARAGAVTAGSES